MKASKGEWFSLNWDLTDYGDPLCYEQYEECPRFLYAEEESSQIESEALNNFYRLRLTSISLTEVFITGDHGIKLPTHYRVGEFMPGDRPTYDEWLSKYHKLKTEIAEHARDKEALNQKSIYLEYTAKIIRHDMHSGINTYIPRGFSGLMRKLPEDVIKKYKLQGSLKLLESGIDHARKVYKDVYSFTNLVKDRPSFDLEECNLKEIIFEYIKDTPYFKHVHISDLISTKVNRHLFCAAINNFIVNGIKYNNSENKEVKIYMKNNFEMYIEDNGNGLTRKEFYNFSRPYIKNIEEGVGFGINISCAILEEHGFYADCEKTDSGSIIKINFQMDSKKSIII
jgi:light-regulated signal transduction histidine kinase (bacteriophytochrome)